MILSISKEGFASKPKREEMHNITFHTVEIDSLIILLDEIRSGHLFDCHYSLQGDYKFVNPDKNTHIKKDNYIGSWFVVIDCDHQKLCMDDFCEMLTDKPTIAYESFSNREGDYRFHLVYCFDEEIVGKENYEKIFSIICKRNNIEYDPQAASPFQLSHGTSPKARTYPTGIPNKLYSISDFLSEEDIKVQTVDSTKSAKPDNDNITRYSYNPLSNNNWSGTFDERLLNSIVKNGFEETYKKFQGKYRHYDASPIELSAGEDEPLIDIPQDYYKINTPFVTDNNGKSHPYLRKNGQRRKRHLYFNCRVRRLILPDITANDLLYSLCYDMWMRIDNTEDPITLGNLMDIVKSSLSYDIALFKYKRPGERMVNPAYRKKYGLSSLDVVRQEGNKKKKEIKENKKQLFLSLYNSNLTIKSNIEEIQAKTGQVFSERTIKRWLKEEGLTRPYKKRSVSPDNDKGGTTDQEEGGKPTESLKSGKNKVISLKVSKPYPKITDDEGFWMVEENYSNYTLMFNFK